MAQQTVLWTVLPNGRREGRWCVSIVVSPRLTPANNAERLLGHAAWAEWADWPATLAAQRFELELPGGTVALKPVPGADLQPDSALWKQLFHPQLALAPFQFKDMSKVNLRSYPLREVLGLLRRHYSAMALQAGQGDHPVLLPWRQADPLLKGLLTELGTRTVSQTFGDRVVVQALPGFSRFHALDKLGRRQSARAIDAKVFSSQSCIKAPVRKPGLQGDTAVFALRALPPRWEDPALLRNGGIPLSDPADREPRAQLMAQFSGPGEYALYQADRFYARTVPTAAQRAMKRPGFSGVPAPLAPPEYDFHQRIASYGDHPNLLRRLGLVLDCVLESQALLDALLAGKPSAQGTMRLRLRTSAPHNGAGDQCPASAFVLSRRRWVMRERSIDHSDGLLRLQGASDSHAHGHSPFDVYQLDPDGAALKTVNFLLSSQNLLGRHLELGADGGVTYTTGDRQPLAALRAGGVGVSRHGRAGQVAMAAAAAALNDAAIRAGGAAARQVTLFAEDVLRGYRVDVFDAKAGRWQSLCARQAQVRALARAGSPELPVKLPADEGHVKGASTTSAEQQPDDHYLHETLFRWTGWSLAAPRPGRHLRDAAVPGTGMQVEEVEDEPTDAAPQGNGLAVQVSAAKGSLPRLRFGREYRLRARLVDLAGNSLALDEPGADEQASEPLRYGRFEPVDPPVLVLNRKLSEGESTERLVLRSNFDRQTAGYTADIAGPLANLYDNPDFEYAASSERHLVPPKSSQLQCELHGLFDAAIGSTDAARIKAAYAVAARESGSLLHPEPGAVIELVTPAKAAQAATVHTGLIAPPELADSSRDRFAAGQYLVHREAIVPVPYLPDPACGGVALEGVPGLGRWTAGKPLVELAPGLLGYVLDKGARAVFPKDQKNRLILLLDFDRDPGDQKLADEWPRDTRSLRLVLLEQPGEVATPPCGDKPTEPDAPRWDFGSGVLHLFLPKGHIARLRYASFVHDELVSQFGLLNWQAPAQAQRLAAEAMAGCNWMLSPWRALTLVHATQQPVCEPRLETLSLPRELGEQHVELSARWVVLHGPSSGQFEIVAEWDEWVDDPAAPKPVRIHHEAVLPEVRLAENHANRFRLADAVAAQTAFTPVGGQVMPQDVQKRPALPGNRHELGDTRFRFIRYRVRATTRFREYLPPKLFAQRERISREGPVAVTHHVKVHASAPLLETHDAGAPIQQVGEGVVGSHAGSIVPASHAPDVPELLYVVPTFRWQRPAPQGHTRSSVRLGNGLRVYLERPWFSSGDGELLGVLIAGEGLPFANLDPSMLPLVTQWGQDPLWDAPVPDTRSHLGDFTAAVASEVVALQEGKSVIVVGHRVHFDAARQLWACDIEINPGAGYTPFVRLALVRYQPHALAGAKVSRVVLADFAQLLPRRRAVLQRDGNAYRVSVHGPASRRGPMRSVNAGGAPEQPYASQSSSIPPAVESRNRLELVLQSQPEALESDLGWTDDRVLGSHWVGGDEADRSAGPELQVQRVEPHTQRRTRGGQTLRFDRLEQVRPVDIVAPVDPPMVFDPAIWNHTVTQLMPLPGRRHRLLLREFERFYTDRTVPEATAGGTVRRRVVVEERLVYAETFEI
jgi:hypothetical protein